MQKLHLRPKVSSAIGNQSSQIVITGSIKDIARPDTTFKVSNVDVLMMRAPVPSDFSLTSDHIVKAEDGHQHHN